MSDILFTQEDMKEYLLLKINEEHKDRFKNIVETLRAMEKDKKEGYRNEGGLDILHDMFQRGEMHLSLYLNLEYLIKHPNQLYKVVV